MKKNCAFIGLGVMGYPMAGHLKKKGFNVTVYNRTAAKAEQWKKEYGGEAAATPAEAAKNADFVMVCVGNDQDVRSVVTGKDGVLASMKAGTTLIDHTTASPKLAVEMAGECKKKNVSFLDAPVSGGQAGAVNGALTIMIGGEEAVHENAKAVIDCYAKQQVLIGAHGHGQACKMLNQTCIAGLLQGLSEGIFLAEKSGIDLKKALAAISKGAAQSWQMENRGETMIKNEFDFGFAVDWMRKDLDICLSSAKEKGITLPVTEKVKGYYDELSAAGFNRSDTSSLIALLRKKNK